MKLFKTVFTAVAITLTASAASAQLIWDRDHLAEVKANLTASAYAGAYSALIESADKMLDVKPLSVMMKEKTAVSGDKHDYLSMGRYYWPDPSKPDGLPYISRDGESNPEIEKLDRYPLGDTAERVYTLSLAYYFSGDEKYARKASELIDVWFLDPVTRMNPHLKYAQMIPGHNNGLGRSPGLIDTYSFIDMLEGVRLLETSTSFSSAQSQALRKWFGDLTDWMLVSEQGKGEDNATNNHSIAYDAQIISFADYAGKESVVKNVLNRFEERRLKKQIKEDGSQPRELQRTIAFHYSHYNVTHIIDILCMARHRGLTLDTEPLLRALDFLTPYVGKNAKEWPYQQINDINPVKRKLIDDLYRTYTYLAPERSDYYNIYIENPEDPTAIFNLIF